jgi:hypothetical protein
MHAIVIRIVVFDLFCCFYYYLIASVMFFNKPLSARLTFYYSLFIPEELTHKSRVGCWFSTRPAYLSPGASS